VGIHPRGASWDAIFADYLDVPSQPRKRWQASPDYVKGLVPSRSFCIDRRSLIYKPLLNSSGAPTNYSRRDVLQNGRELFWRPWGLNGRFTVEDQSRWSQVMSAPLLGRFDQFVLDRSKHSGRQPRESSRDVPFYRRQQIGFPFACQVTDNAVSRLDAYADPPYPALGGGADGSSVRPGRLPLATINVLLTQRSARLTFIERLVTEDATMRAFTGQAVGSRYAHFDPANDIGLLTDGWGDLFLVLFDRRRNEYREQHDLDWLQSYLSDLVEIEKRLWGIVLLRRYLFRDPLVVRSETSYTPAAFDAALLRPDRYQCTISIRFRSSRIESSGTDRFEERLRNDKGFSNFFTMTRISGRLDYSMARRREISADELNGYLSGLCAKRLTDAGSYGVFYEALRDEMFDVGGPNDLSHHIDSTSSAISEYIT
jgi:hypothetical protein